MEVLACKHTKKGVIYLIYDALKKTKKWKWKLPRELQHEKAWQDHLAR